MEFYHLTLHPASNIVNAVSGDFTGENQKEVVVSTGRILKLLRFNSKTLRLEILFIVDTYSTIHSLVKCRFQNESKDWVIISADSGHMIILKCNLEKKTFDKVFENTLCASQCPRLVPGQHLAVDSKGRAVMIGAMEKVKGIWVLPNNSNNGFLFEASTENVLVYDIVYVDADTENPLFACLETTYTELYPKQRLHCIPKQRLVFYEIDMKTRKVQCKESIDLKHRSNSLISVPGEKGVLVCSENFITFVETDCSAIQCPIPRHLTDSRGGVIVVCSTLYESNENTILYLVQTERGDIFKVKLEKEECRVNEIIMEYFHTIPVSSALCLLDSGFLFAAAEFGNHHVYKILDTDEVSIPHFSSALSEKMPFFLPFLTNHLVTVAELQSLCPIRHLDFASLWDVEAVELCVSRGRGPSSVFRVLNQELDKHKRMGFSEIQKDVGTPTAIWAMERKKYVETFVLVSFESRTDVFLVSDNSIKKFKSSFFRTDFTTLGCSETGDHHFLQICPVGIYVFWDNGDVLINIKRIETRTMEANPRKNSRTSIESCAINSNSIILALEIGSSREVTTELVHYEISKLFEESAQDERNFILQRRLMDKRKLMKVTCMLLSDEEMEDQLLAVGVKSQESGCIEVYKVQPLFVVKIILDLKRTCPESLLFLKTDSGMPSLMIGAQGGFLVTTVFDTTDEDRPRIKKINFRGCQKPVRLLKARVLDDDAVLAISNYPWLKYSSDTEFTELEFDLPHLVCSIPQSQLFAGFSTDSLMIFNFQEAITMPLEYTPRMFVCDPGSKNFISIETDYNSYTEETNKVMAEKMKKEISEATENGDPISRPSDVDLCKYARQGSPGRWASLIRIFNVETEETVFRLILQQDAAAVSLRIMTFEQIGSILLVGMAKNLVLNSGKCTEASVRTYRIVKNGTALELFHETPVKDVPMVICPFLSDVLIGTGNVLRLYAMGEKSLQMICKKRCVDNRIIFIHCRGSMIVVGDSVGGVSYLLYSSESERLFLFGEDVGPSGLAGACLLANNLMARTYKSGDLFIVRFPEIKVKEKTDVPSSSSDKELPFCASEEEVIARFHIGEIAVSLQAVSIYPKKPEAVVYGTLSGSIGILSRFSSKEQFKVMESLESRLLVQSPRPFNKNHLQFRSRNYPPTREDGLKNVIDGDFCEQFLSLDAEEQKKLIGHSTDPESISPEQFSALIAELRENHSFEMKL